MRLFRQGESENGMKTPKNTLYITVNYYIVLAKFVTHHNVIVCADRRVDAAPRP